MGHRERAMEGVSRSFFSETGNNKDVQAKRGGAVQDLVVEAGEWRATRWSAVTAASAVNQVVLAAEGKKTSSRTEKFEQIDSI